MVMHAKTARNTELIRLAEQLSAKQLSLRFSITVERVRALCKEHGVKPRSVLHRKPRPDDKA